MKHLMKNSPVLGSMMMRACSAEIDVSMEPGLVAMPVHKGLDGVVICYVYGMYIIWYDLYLPVGSSAGLEKNRAMSLVGL